MIVACLDLEGVLVPEIWIGVAQRTGIAELRLTTREVPDYDQLMSRRLQILAEHGLGLPDIQQVIQTLEPLPGACAFLDALRERMQLVILSDTFYQFAVPLMRQLGWPTLFCHDLVVDPDGRIRAYRLRQRDPKRKAVEALRSLCFQVVAAGDSYNDIPMLEAAQAGILFRPPEKVVQEFPRFPVAHGYEELDAAFRAAEARLS